MPEWRNQVTRQSKAAKLEIWLPFRHFGFKNKLENPNSGASLFQAYRQGNMGKNLSSANTLMPLANNVILLILIGLSLVAIIATYLTQGPSWDFVAQFLNARSYSTSQFISGAFHLSNYFIVQNNLFYIEIFRPPIESAILAVIMHFVQNPMLFYLIVLFSIFLLSIRFFGRSLNVDTLLVYGLMLNPYFIYLSFTVDSTDILSLSMVLVAIAFLYKKDPMCGAFFALAGLSKYPALIFLPMVILLEKPGKVFMAFALFLLFTIPWLAINYVYFGSPLASYTSSIDITLANPSLPTSISAYPAIIALLIPVAFLAFGLLQFKLKDIKKIIMHLRQDHSYARMLSLFIPLSAICYLILSMHSIQFDQIRFADFIALSAILVSLPILQKGSEKMPTISRNIAIFSLLIMTIATVSNFSAYHQSGNVYGPYNINYNGSVVHMGLDKLSSMGYGGCKVFSNSWVYLVYLNANAYSPFSVNSTNSGTYPLIIFKQIGVSPSFISNLSRYKIAYNGSYYSILLPDNASCVR